MQLDRIAIDIINWLKSLFSPAIKRSPVVLYQEMLPHGLIQKVDRNTERAIATWIFTPKKDGVPSHQHARYFLCLDTLRSEELNYRHTHRISIWKASPWGSLPDDGFDTDQVYTALYDLSLNNQYSDRWGAAVLQNLAKELGRIGLSSFGEDKWAAWQNQVRLSILSVLGKHRSPSDWLPLVNDWH